MRHDSGRVSVRPASDVERAMCAAVGASLARVVAVPAVEARARIALGVSGGIDSMVLLDLAARTVPAERLIVATFDHGTGRDASAAAALVASRAAALGIECVAGQRAPERGRRLQSEAVLRSARWGFLRELARARRAVVATAHTRDDQVETVLMRVLRGSGARGLAGLYAESAVLRPLLAFTRAEIETYASLRAIRWIDDPSNASRQYLRNRVRHDLLPAMRAAAPGIDGEIISIAERAAECRSAVEAAAASLVVEEFDGGSRGRGLDVDAALLSSCTDAGIAVLWAAVAARAGVTLDRRGTARLVAFTVNPRVGSRVQVAGGWQVVRSRDALQLRPSAANTPGSTPLGSGSVVRWGNWRFRRVKIGIQRTVTPADGWSIQLAAGAAASIRAWRPGDALVLRPGGTPRKVKHLLSSAGVTGHDRAGWPVVVVDGQIVWVPGVVGTSASAPAGAGQSATRSADFGLAFECEQLSR